MVIKPKYELLAGYSLCFILLITNVVQENNVALSLLFSGLMFFMMYIEHRKKISYLDKIKEFEESATHFYKGLGVKYVRRVMYDDEEMIGSEYNTLMKYLETLDRNSKRNLQIINLMTTSSESPIVILNNKSEIEYANQSFRMWVSVTLLKRMTVNEITVTTVKRILQDALITESRRTQIMVHEGKHYQTIANPIYDASSIFSGVVIMFHDITDLKKYELLQKEFFSSVSHELKTPISAIKGCTEILMSGAKENEEILDEFLTIIKDENERMERLVQDLMLLNRYDHAQGHIRNDRVCMNEVLSSCILDVLNIATLKNQKIMVHANEEGYVLGDMVQLKHCFLNLLTNAIHYSHEQTTIHVKLIVNSNQITVRIRDEGIGIPPQDVTHIFERFYRVDKARTRNTGGTGLGLSLVKSIVLAHEAFISVKSKQDVGTTFTLTFKKAA